MIAYFSCVSKYIIDNIICKMYYETKRKENKMSRKLKKLPHGKTLQQMLNMMTLFAKKYPSKVPEFSKECIELIAKYNDDTHNFHILPVKGEYVVVIGNIYTTKEELECIAASFGIIKLKFIESDKLTNLESLVDSERCIGVIMGGAPHSLPGNVEVNFKEKFFPATVGDKRRITKKSFETAIENLMKYRTRLHIIEDKRNKSAQSSN